MVFFRLEGAPIAFKNVNVVQRLGRIIADQTCIHFDVDADFIVFKPSIGCTLKGLQILLTLNLYETR